MPLYKKSPQNSGKKNQGNQWGDTGSAGNIHTLPRDGSPDHPAKGPVSTKRIRNKTIGR